MRRDQMRLDAEPQQAQAVLEIMLPDGLVPFLELFSAPDIIDDHIKTALLGSDASDQLLHFLRDQMIDLHRYAGAAGCGHKLRRFFYGFRTGIFGWSLARGASRHINGRPCRAQFDGDPSTRAPRSTGDQGDLSLKRNGIHLQASTNTVNPP